MFTGIIEETGIVRALQRRANIWQMEIEAGLVLKDTKIGDSIAVDGVCFTIIGKTDDEFTVEVSAETRARSTIKSWSTGTEVNLERALLLGSRLGGHMVQGHVDTEGGIISMEKAENSLTLGVRVGREWRRYLASKGAVAVDGISLTIAELSADSFSVVVIPHTLAHTTLLHKKTGDSVNIECDIIAKYVESLLGAKKADETVIDTAFLREKGFIS